MSASRMSIKDDVAVQALMATPSTSVATLTICGVAVNDLILIGTGVLLVLQIGYLVHKWYRLATTKEATE